MNLPHDSWSEVVKRISTFQKSSASRRRREKLSEGVLEVVNGSDGRRHGTAFLGTFQRRNKEQRLIVSAGHVVQDRRVDVVDQYGRRTPVRFHQIQHRDVAVGIVPDELSDLQGFSVAEFLSQPKHQVMLLTRRYGRVIEEKGWLKGRVLPNVCFYQLEEGGGGDGTSGSPVLNDNQEVVAVHTGGRNRLSDGYHDGGSLGELLISNNQTNTVERFKMSLNVLRLFFGF
jgi:hypothetical protein